MLLFTKLGVAWLALSPYTVYMSFPVVASNGSAATDFLSQEGIHCLKKHLKNPRCFWVYGYPL